jgi:hypothetical protein
MSLQSLLNALVAKKGQDYLTEFSAFGQEVVDQMTNLQLALLAGVTATSVSNATLQTGQQSIDIGLSKAFVTGMRINVANTATAYMVATVVSYTNSGAGPLVFNVASADDVAGAGTFASWTVSLAGDEGPAGPAWYSNGGTKTANYQLVSGESIVANTAGGAFNVTTPNGGALTPNVTRFKVIKRGGSQLNILRGTGGVTLNGLADDSYIPADKTGVLEAVATSATDFQLTFIPTAA